MHVNLQGMSVCRLMGEVVIWYHHEPYNMTTMHRVSELLLSLIGQRIIIEVAIGPALNSYSVRLTPT